MQGLTFKQVKTLSALHFMFTITCKFLL